MWIFRGYPLHNNQVNATAKPRRGLVPSALRAPAARYLYRYAELEGMA